MTKEIVVSLKKKIYIYSWKKVAGTRTEARSLKSNRERKKSKWDKEDTERGMEC